MLGDFLSWCFFFFVCDSDYKQNGFSLLEISRDGRHMYSLTWVTRNGVTTFGELDFLSSMNLGEPDWKLVFFDFGVFCIEKKI